MTEPQPQDPHIESPPDNAAANPPAPSSSGRPPADSPSADVGAAETPAVVTTEEQLAAAKMEAAANYDRYLRAVADLENYRRRAAREREEVRQFAAVNLLQHLLPVLDNLQLAIVAARQEGGAKTIVDGVAMVLEQLKAVLTRHGLMELNPGGEKFNPHLHESLSHQPSADVPEEHILQVVRTGYSFHGRLLRPASVVLSSGPAKEAKK